MSSPRRFLLFLALILFIETPAHALEKWLYHSTNLLVEKNIDALETLWRRAAAAGYTHVLLADSKFSRLGEMGARYFKNLDRVKRIAAALKLEVAPALFSVGYSNDLLSLDTNLIEGPPVKDQPLIVRDGVARIDTTDAPALPGGDCSDLNKWSWKDDVVVADNGAARITDAGGKNARLSQRLKLKPWRQYHVSVRVKTQDFHGQPEIKALPAKDGAPSLQWANLGVKPTQDWKEHHVVFNSLEYTDISLYFGVWGAGRGDLWWDDAKIEEVAFVNITRRPGTPLAIKTADGKAQAEGKDFEPLRDPLLGSKPWPGEYDSWHEPPKLRTQLPDGTKLLASYFHGTTIYDGQAAICLSEPKTYALLRDQAKRMHAAWGAKAYMMSHDELRVANWCDACQSRHLTPGQLLADNMRRCVGFIREVAPDARLYVWNDMFDPHHNALPDPYYLVNGPLTGSWEGLPKDVAIMQWNFGKRAESLKFFADRGHAQVIAGYYDGPLDDLRKWFAAAKGMRGVEGVMYTTWRHDFSQLETFSTLIDEAAKQ